MIAAGQDIAEKLSGHRIDMRLQKNVQDKILQKNYQDTGLQRKDQDMRLQRNNTGLQKKIIRTLDCRTLDCRTLRITISYIAVSENLLVEQPFWIAKYNMSLLQVIHYKGNLKYNTLLWLPSFLLPTTLSA